VTYDRKAARVPHQRLRELNCVVRHRGAANRTTAGGPLLNRHRCTAEPSLKGIELRVSAVDGRIAVVTVSGEIDLRTAERLRGGLLGVAGAGYRRVIVDFTGVRFCDATGLGVLIATRNRLSESGGRLVLAGVRPTLRRLFDVTNLGRLFPMRESVESALLEGQPQP
jgi:anti-anti-sigma factor